MAPDRPAEGRECICIQCGWATTPLLVKQPLLTLLLELLYPAFNRAWIFIKTFSDLLRIQAIVHQQYAVQPMKITIVG